eukprot:TRINITY_DN45761_c0_g1_i1.p1 TRINITY_DN45761_c0_g1~~TRINITY_DN45761_c0_g1_i1.p1  ORF type:complete len:514 (+),score=88.37 TRINITY_DN45761_c0_g1_i1:117-1658(+)
MAVDFSFPRAVLIFCVVGLCRYTYVSVYGEHTFIEVTHTGHSQSTVSLRKPLHPLPAEQHHPQDVGEHNHADLVPHESEASGNQAALGDGSDVSPAAAALGLTREMLIAGFQHHAKDFKVPPLGVTGKLLYFRPRMAGVYNQLEEFLHAALLARQLGRRLVLPYIAEAVSWDRNRFDILHPYHDYFDPVFLAGAVATASTKQFLERCNRTVAVDLRPKPNRKHANAEYERRLDINVSGAEIIDWPLARLKAESPTLPDCLGVHWPRHLVAPLLSYKRGKDDPPLVGLAERSTEARRVLRHIWYNPMLLEMAESAARQLGRYLAVHLRIGDFNLWCGGRHVPQRCPTAANVWENIVRHARDVNSTTVFVAVEPRYRANTLRTWRKRVEDEKLALTFVTIADIHGLNETLFAGRPDVLGTVEHAICAKGDGFLGNAWSTWSRGVHERRYTSGLSCAKEFLFERQTNGGHVCVEHADPLEPEVRDGRGSPGDPHFFDPPSPPPVDTHESSVVRVVR